MHTSAKTKHIVVVGAGPGGLTAAMILSSRGFRVSVFEAQERLGGRNAELRLGPYVFDTGPTFLMLKPIMEEVFREAGADAHQLLKIQSLDPLYRLQFHDRSIDFSSDGDAMQREIERVFPGLSKGYARFRQCEARRFARMTPCLQKSYHRFRTLFHPDMLRAIPHLSLGRSLYDVAYKYFGDEELALCFTFQSKYIGMSPWDCPGVFAMIPYMEHSHGVQHVEGGLSRISDAMAEVAIRNGAAIRLSAPVRRIVVKNRAVEGVQLENGEFIEADDVVINADFGYAATNLFEPGVLRKYTPEKLERMRLSCSIFMLYLGIDRLVSSPHHLIVFAEGYRKFVESIFREGELSKDISFYVRNAGQSDSTLAPPGHTALYVLVPVPNNRSGIDWDRERHGFRETVLDTIARRTELGDLRPHIRVEKIITPADWQREYRVYEGATFNLAHNVGQMLYWRPHNRFEELDHCYLVGGGTHPGSGLPTIYESGRIAANLICRAYGIPFTSHNLEI